MSGMRAFRFLPMAALAVFLAACASRPSPPPPPEPPTSLLGHLDERHILYEPLKEFQTAEGCHIDTPVRIRQTSLAFASPAVMSASLALVLWDWETTVVAPAAQRLLGAAPRRLTHMGAYSCRAERSSHAERLSQHAFGKAFDISGFELDNGTTVSVLADWSAGTAKSRFLHEVAQGACRLFAVVMSPNSNALHRNHLHLDIGPYRHCGA